MAKNSAVDAEFGKQRELESLIPKITQETLAEMIGAPRSRVNSFMNRFRNLSFIEYTGRIVWQVAAECGAVRSTAGR